jgi:hypothetical protein
MGSRTNEQIEHLIKVIEKSGVRDHNGTWYSYPPGHYMQNIVGLFGERWSLYIEGWDDKRKAGESL